MAATVAPFRAMTGIDAQMSELTQHELSEMPEMLVPRRYIPPWPDLPRYHWIRRFRGGPAIPLFWNATWHANGADGWGKWSQPDREDQWEYCGPCPSPDQINHNAVTSHDRN